MYWIYVGHKYSIVITTQYHLTVCWCWERRAIYLCLWIFHYCWIVLCQNYWCFFFVTVNVIWYITNKYIIIVEYCWRLFCVSNHCTFQNKRLPNSLVFIYVYKILKHLSTVVTLCTRWMVSWFVVESVHIFIATSLWGYFHVY